MKKIKIVIVVAVLTLLASGCSVEREIREMEIFADSLYFDDVETLTEWSDHLVRLYVLNSRVEYLNIVPNREEMKESLINQGRYDEIDYILSLSSFDPVYEVVTIYDVEIIEVFHGNLEAGMSVEILRPGGIYNQEYWFIAHQVTLEVGEELVAFLWENPGDFPFALAALFQGVYRINRALVGEYESLLELDDLTFELENLGAIDNLVLTVEDLNDIFDGTISSDRSRERRNARRRDRN